MNIITVILFSVCLLILVDEMDNYLDYLGGIFGAITIAGLATATIYYFLARPIPEKPLVPLHNQSPILEVSKPDASIQ